MRRRRLPALVVLALIALIASGVPGCLSEATEILCFVSTDLPPQRPLTIEAHAAFGRRASTDSDPLVVWTRSADAGLPQSFALRPISVEQRSATVTMVVLGRAEGLGVMRHVVRLPFVPGRTQVARIFLSANCLRLVPGVRCAAAGLPAADCLVRDLCEASGLTCGINGQCVSIDVDPEARSDASVAFDALPFVSCGLRGEPCCPGAVCHSGALCNVDLCVGCGQPGERCCGSACSAGSACTAGQCVFCGADGVTCGPAPDPCHDAPRCMAGRCTADPGMACRAGETDCCRVCADLLRDPMRCGTCTNSCPVPPNGSAACVSGTCGIVCNDRHHACGSSCREDADPTACGASCRACPVPSGGSATCVTGTCQSQCPSGRTLCGTTCVDTSSDTNHCGACGRVCVTGSGAASVTCNASRCVSICMASRGDCDGDDSNGCEIVLQSTSNCGACGRVCSGAYTTCVFSLSTPMPRCGRPLTGATWPTCAGMCTGGEGCCENPALAAYCCQP